MIKTICIAAAAACTVAACGTNHSSSDIHAGPATSVRSAAATAQSSAEAVKAAVPEVTELIAITEDNDANNMIGRSNGYVAATVIVDSRAEHAQSGLQQEQCSREKPGIVCGAGVEQWPDAAATQKRADYLKTIQSSMPFLGTEYQWVKGALLLRVAGTLKPSEAAAYQAAFMR